MERWNGQGITQALAIGSVLLSATALVVALRLPVLQPAEDRGKAAQNGITGVVPFEGAASQAATGQKADGVICVDGSAYQVQSADGRVRIDRMTKSTPTGDMMRLDPISCKVDLQ